MINLGNVLIIGDSYSTFKDFIPTNCDTWYPNAETDVENVEQTWWKMLLEETESNLILNNSFSGTTICNTGYGGADCTKISFIGRFKAMLESGFFNENKIDTVFIFGGTNDSWADAPLGTYIDSDWQESDLFSVLPGFSYLLHIIKENLPTARVICVLNTELKVDLTDGLKQICDKNSVEKVVLKKIDKIASHPSIMGMKKIKDQILEAIKN